MAYLEYPTHQFFDNNGNPLASGKIYTYAAGTTTDLATYVSASGAANTNPIILDSAGRCDIWLAESTQYKLVVKSSSDTTIDTFDYVQGITSGNTLSATLTGDLNTNSYSIVTTSSNFDITLDPHGTGSTIINAPKLADSLDCNGFNIEMDNSTGLVDDSGNETLILGKATSAVNYVKVTNAATGNNPTVEALGDDSAVGLDFQIKGSGTYNFKGSSSVPTTLNFYEDTDNGTNKISVVAPSSISSDATLTLPTTTGTLYATNNTDVSVADGGTGVSSLTAYAVLCGGTTSTGAVQSIASVGTATHVLTSNGAGALPTFQAVPAAGIKYLGQLNSGNSYSSTTILTDYTTFLIVQEGGYLVSTSTSAPSFTLQIYHDGGWLTTSYVWYTSGNSSGTTIAANNNTLAGVSSGWCLTNNTGTSVCISNGCNLILTTSAESTGMKCTVTGTIQANPSYNGSSSLSGAGPFTGSRFISSSAVAPTGLRLTASGAVDGASTAYFKVYALLDQ